MGIRCVFKLHDFLNDEPHDVDQAADYRAPRSCGWPGPAVNVAVDVPSALPTNCRIPAAASLPPMTATGLYGWCSMV